MKKVVIDGEELVSFTFLASDWAKFVTGIKHMHDTTELAGENSDESNYVRFIVKAAEDVNQ